MTSVLPVRVTFDRGDVPLWEMHSKDFPHGQLELRRKLSDEVFHMPEVVKEERIPPNRVVELLTTLDELVETVERLTVSMDAVPWASSEEKLLAAVARARFPLPEQTLLALSRVNNTGVRGALWRRELSEEVRVSSQMTQVASYQKDFGLDAHTFKKVPIWLLRTAYDLLLHVKPEDEEDYLTLWNYMLRHAYLPLEIRASLVERQASHERRYGGWFDVGWLKRIKTVDETPPLAEHIRVQFQTFYPDLLHLPHNLRVQLLAEMPVSDPTWFTPVPEQWVAEHQRLFPTVQL